ncbi:PAS-associated C-terminal [Penicillium sp. IBT 35674x]|nr:PAS-associated C-terminal [Penicillium sp. IBT 35674x]
MDIPDIPDDRPHKPASVLTSPTIVLDDYSPDYPESQYQNRTQESLNLTNGEQTPEQCPTPPNDSSDLRSQPSLKQLRRNFIVNDPHELPLLQATNPNDGAEEFYPVDENDEDGSFDLVAPYEGERAPLHTLERQADTMFSPEHMLAILTNPRYLARFREFLLKERPKSIPVLTYYLNASKALKALEYANSLIRLSVLLPPAGIEAAKQPVELIINHALEARVQDGLNALTADELPAFITSTCINITSKVVEERVRGTLPEKFQGTADALAEVFCLTDPSRPDNPIIFASGEFHRTTQYGMDYVLGRNCRFLQGPKTNPNSVRRIREAVKAGRHHSELFLNYRRDGSPFMNLLQCAPLCDSQGKVRYFIGAQVDVSGLAMEGAQMESLQALTAQKARREAGEEEPQQTKSEFQELGELFSPRELQNIHAYGGNLFQPIEDRINPTNSRLFIPGSPDYEADKRLSEAQLLAPSTVPSGSLTGVYKHYLLVRPYPSLRVLFTSPSLQIPGMLQSSFLSRIGDTGEKKDSIVQAMMEGRSVTARIKWVTRFSENGRHRWIHCTPLLANNGGVGVWMIVVMDDEEEHYVRWKGNWPMTQ